MKGLVPNQIIVVIIAIVALVIALFILFAFVNPGTKEGYMNLPKGVWMSVSSADSKIFVPPSIVWFGEDLSLGNGKVSFGKVFKKGSPTDFIFPATSVYISDVLGITSGSNINYLDILGLVLFSNSLPTGIGFEQNVDFAYSTFSPVSPMVAMYPLLTDRFNYAATNQIRNCDNEFCYFNTRNSFGSINFSMSIDAKELKKYYLSRGYNFDLEKFQENINLTLRYMTDLDMEPNNYLELIEIEENTTTLKELSEKGVCKCVETNCECSFKFNVTDKCCPNFVSITPIFLAKLTKAESLRWVREDMTPVFFQVAYYLDLIGDENYLFEKFSELQDPEKKIFARENEPSPLKNINIYPCRAKVRAEEQPLLYTRIKGLTGETIDWDKCGKEEFVRLPYTDSKEGDTLSTWYCKDEGDYYIYNPYAYCKLDGEELPKMPQPTYLEGIIPSGEITKEAGVPILTRLFGIEVPYGKYRESALIWAVYVIENFPEFIKGNVNVEIPEDREIGNVKVNFKFS